ncbi:MAG: hypothetical protein ACR2P2_03020 [Nakamurella sp.]
MDTMFEVIERLHGQFGVRLARTQILAVTQQCRDQLDSVPAAARPELLERLARQRLTGRAHNQPAGARHNADSGVPHLQ